LVLKENKKMIVEKNQDKLQKVEMTKIEREDFFKQKAEQNKEKMRKIYENNLYASLENVTFFGFYGEKIVFRKRNLMKF